MSHPVIDRKKGLKLNLKIQKPNNFPTESIIVLKGSKISLYVKFKTIIDVPKNENCCCEFGTMPRDFIQFFEVQEKIGEVIICLLLLFS